MPDFTGRSYKTELLDRNDIPFNDIKQNMKELNNINSMLGGHNITLQGLKKLAGKKKQLSICEIGCGGGDNLLAIYKYCSSHKINITLTGVDINKECISFARSRDYHNLINYIASDYRMARFIAKPDIIFSSLFCHHFTNQELVEMLQWMQLNSSLGFFINDLHRHPIAYHFIRFATSLFSNSYLVKNDAPLSVLRSFKKEEWKNLLQSAGITSYSIEWKWAYRYLVTYQHDQ